MEERKNVCKNTYVCMYVYIRKREREIARAYTEFCLSLSVSFFLSQSLCIALTVSCDFSIILFRWRLWAVGYVDKFGVSSYVCKVWRSFILFLSKHKLCIYVRVCFFHLVCSLRNVFFPVSPYPDGLARCGPVSFSSPRVTRIPWLPWSCCV